jgi:hypothetical protein
MKEVAIMPKARGGVPRGEPHVYARIPHELYLKVHQARYAKGIPLKDWIIEAIQEKLKRESKEIRK